MPFTDASLGSGRASVGAVLKVRRNSRLDFVDGVSKTAGLPTTDVAEAECLALIEGLKLARKHGVRRIRVFLDRESLVAQMSEVAHVRQTAKSVQAKALVLYRAFPDRRVSWLPPR